MGIIKEKNDANGIIEIIILVIIYIIIGKYINRTYINVSKKLY